MKYRSWWNKHGRSPATRRGGLTKYLNHSSLCIKIISLLKIFPTIFYLCNATLYIIIHCINLDRYTWPELGTRFFLRFALALSRSLAELFALALLRSFLGLKFRAFAFALSRFRAPWFFALLDFSRFFSRSSLFALVISCSCVYIRLG